MDFATMGSVGSVIVAVVALLASLAANMRKDTKDDSMQMARLMAKLDSIGDDLKEVKADVTGLRQSIQDNHDRIIILERDMQTAWKRIDELRAKAKEA